MKKVEGFCSITALLVGMGQLLDLVVLEVFSNCNDCMIL